MAINNVINGEAASSVRDKINQAINGVNSLSTAGYATVQYITNLIANYYLKNETYSKGEVNNLIANIQGFQLKVISNISEVVDPKFIYLLPISGKTNNSYSEYLYINGKPELMGEFNTSIDLSNYITSGQLTAALSAYVTSSAFNTAISNLANTYVAKEAGKSLIEDTKIAKLDSLPSSVFSQAETQQAINTAIEGVNSAGTRVSFVKEYKNGTLEYIGENGVILQDIYSKMIELMELPTLENEAKSYDITSEPIGNNLYLVIDNITISGGIDVFSSINNDHYKFEIIREPATSIPKLKCTCLITNTKEFTAKIKLSYIKYFGEKVSFSIECADEDEANNLELSIPPLKHNKENIIGYSFDDNKMSYYCVGFALVNNRPIMYNQPSTVWGTYGANLYHANNLPPEEHLVRLNKTIGYTDGCGNERRMKLGYAIWDGELDIARDGLSTSPYRYMHPYLTWDELKDVIEFGSAIQVHNAPQPNGTVDEIVESYQVFRDLALSHVGRGFKTTTRPDGNSNYVFASLEFPEHLCMAVETNKDGYIHTPYNPYTTESMYKMLVTRIFSDDVQNYYNAVVAEMAKPKEQRVLLNLATHNTQIDYVNFIVWLNDTYGKDGTDVLWLTHLDEVYEYWYMRKYSKIIKSVTGNTANFDVYIPKGQYFYYPELTFVTNQNISEVSNIHDKIKGFSFNQTNMFNINLDANLVTLAEKYTARFETNQLAIDKQDALYFANQLRADLKSSFVARINAVENVPLDSLAISGGDVADLLIGETTQLTAVFTPSNTGQRNVKWESDDEGIATVNSNGLVTCIGAGEATITLSSVDNVEISITKKITCVSSRPITGITITGNVNGVVNDTIQLLTVLTPSNTTQTDIIWSTSDNSLADVNQEGLVSLKAEGVVDIRATSAFLESIFDEHKISIMAEAVPIISITVNGKTPLEVGSNAQFTVVYNPTNTTERGIVWTSSNNSVATVDSNGLVTAVGVGNATITASSINRPIVLGNKEVIVNAQVIAITGLEITGNTSVNSGNTLQLGINYTPSNTTQQGVTWSSSDETKATVNSNGLVTAIAEGAVVITATSTINGAISDTHNVTINAVSNLYAVIKVFGGTAPSGGYGIKEYNGWKYSAIWGQALDSPNNTFYWSDNSVAGRMMEVTIEDVTPILGSNHVKNAVANGITATLPADKWYPDEFYKREIYRPYNPNPTPPYAAAGFIVYNLAAGTYKVKIWDVLDSVTTDGKLYNVNGNVITPFTGHRFTASNPDVHGTSTSKPQLKEITVTIGTGEDITILSYNTAPTVAFDEGAALSAIEIEKIG